MLTSQLQTLRQCQPHLQRQREAAQVLAVAQVRLVSSACDHHHGHLAVLEVVRGVGAALTDLEDALTLDACA